MGYKTEGLLQLLLPLKEMVFYDPRWDPNGRWVSGIKVQFFLSRWKSALLAKGLQLRKCWWTVRDNLRGDTGRRGEREWGRPFWDLDCLGSGTAVLSKAFKA